MNLAFNPNKGEEVEKAIIPFGSKPEYKTQEIDPSIEKNKRVFNKLIAQLRLESELDSIEIEQYNPSEHIDHSKLNNIREDYEQDVEFREDYSFIENVSVLDNVEQFSKLTKEITDDPDYKAYSRDLESIRLFPKDFLSNRGIFLSLSKQDLIDTFPYLRNSSLYLTSTDEAYANRYMLPIRLPNGDTITHTGYRPPQFEIEGPKYETSFYSWMSQGSVIGNMESLMMYESKNIYVVEGMFDAYRINQVLESPSIALLGSILTKEKTVILNLLKSQGYVLIYVPDQDEAGMSSRLLNNKLFDNIMTYGDYEIHKDFDFYCGSAYVERLKDKFEGNTYKIENSTLLDLTEDEIETINIKLRNGVRYKNPIDITLPSYGSMLK